MKFLSLPPIDPSRLSMFALAGGAFLTGLSAGCALGPGPNTVPALVAATGAVLLLAFRAYEGRAMAQEERIEDLEAQRLGIESVNKRLEGLHDSIFQAAAATLSGIVAADDHRSRVAPLVTALGQALELEDDALAGLRAAALLHDIGRLGVPTEVWNQQGALSADEWEQVKTHPEQAARWLAPIAFPWPVAEAVRSQGERWDGFGYPDRLRGSEIPLGGRILAVADAYHAMRCERPHRPAMDHRTAMEALEREAGGRFDPDIVAAFVRLAGKGDLLQTLAPAPFQKQENPTTVRLSGAGADERI